MKTIYKFPLKIKDEQLLNLPTEYRVVLVGLDPQDIPCIWCLLDPTHITYQTRIFIVGTGQMLPAQAKKALGSFVQKPFVWHAFSN